MDMASHRRKGVPDERTEAVRSHRLYAVILVVTAALRKKAGKNLPVIPAAEILSVLLHTVTGRLGSLRTGCLEVPFITKSVRTGDWGSEFPAKSNSTQKRTPNSITEANPH